MSTYSHHWKNPKFSVKMSARESSGYSVESEEEEELVRRVGGRGWKFGANSFESEEGESREDPSKLVRH